MFSETKSIRLDPVLLEEAGHVEVMAARIWPTAYGKILSPAQIDYMLGRGYSPEALARDIKLGIRYRWIFDGADTIGFLAYELFDSPRNAFLHRFYLETSCQGRGVGTQALEVLKGELLTEGASGLDLRVNRHNHDAIAFYQKRGFQITGEDRLDIGGGFVMDDYLMTLPF